MHASAIVRRIRIVLAGLVVAAAPIVLAVAAVSGVSFALQGESTAEDSSAKPSSTPVTTRALGGAVRYLTHLSTDKPLYRPGETVWVRGVVLHADTRTPIEQNAARPALVEIRGPKGNVVASAMARTEASVAAFQWKVPSGQAGGQYKVRLSHPWTGHAAAEREFEVRAYRAPRLETEIVFVREGYGPGDEVAAVLHVERAEGGMPVGAGVTILARVDGADVHRSTSTVDAAGNSEARFALPTTIARGEGALSFVVEDGGVVETAVKTIPILLQTVDLAFYPESGDLVAGLLSRVYVEARTPATKPADIVGRIVDESGRGVARVRTTHEGRGVFSFTPQKGTKYALEIVEPAGIATRFPLPAVRDAGGVLRALAEVYPTDRPVAFDAAVIAGGRFTVTLSQREKEIARTTVLGYEPGSIARVRLTPPLSAAGVLIATLWDAEGSPVAERLVFREPSGGVRVRIEADREKYAPAGEVALTVHTTDASGAPVPATVGLTVTDDSVLELIERRDRAPRLPVMVFLENDVRELADAHVYLDTDDPEAPRALDLLLGTQGWRRFALVNAKEFLREHGDQAARALAFRKPVAARHLGRGGGADGDRLWADGAADKGAAVERFREDNKPKADAAPVADDPAAAAQVDALRKAEARDARGPDVAKKPAERPAGPRLAKELAAGLEMADADDEAILLQPRGVRRSRRSMAIAYVREYAHRLAPNHRAGDRVDFTETVYFHAGLRTDEAGTAKVKFWLSDSVTTFRVLADAFDDAGNLGAGDLAVESVEPFYIEPKLPLEVTQGDVIQLPVVAANGTDAALGACALNVTAGKGIAFVDGSRRELVLPSGERVRAIVPLRVDRAIEGGVVTISGTAGPHSDSVTRPLRVVPAGFPVEIAQGGVLETDGKFTWTVVVPDDLIARSLTSEAKAYPSPVANLTAALERLIREPHGCFEQTSSTTYPLVMAQQYFTTHSGVDPAIIERSSRLLEKGYKRLTGFECKEKGYEWFGKDPGHEALTAYGLLEFSDMSKVREVDQTMLDRTRQWLLGTRDGKGSFSRERRALHTWVADPECSNGYILWSLLESGEEPASLQAEIDAFLKAARATENSYAIALGALVAAHAGDDDVAKKLRGRLAKLQADDGQVEGATMSIVGSRGNSLSIETTSLATLSWLRDRTFSAHVEKAMRWIAAQCEAGRYGSTQSSVLALRAIVEYDKLRSGIARSGQIEIVVDGHRVGEPVAFDETSRAAIELPDISEMLFPGEHRVELRMTDGSEIPFSLAIRLHRTRPDSSAECAVGLDVELASKTIVEGASTEARVRFANLSDETVPTPLAIVGLPGGLEVRHEQLKELVDAGKIAAYEVLGREVVLYWRALDKKAVVELSLDLVGAVPGSYTGPASRSYLYYGDEHKQWVAPLVVEVTPRSGE